jgi:hypothetical protein
MFERLFEMANPPNPFEALGAAINGAVQKANKKRLDDAFADIEPSEYLPVTHSIRTYGDGGNELLRGLIHAFAELERRLPPPESGKGAA